MKTVSFAKMEDCTAEDIAWVEEIESRFAEDVADRVLAHLKSLETEPTPLQVDRLEHSLQTATHAHRGGADEETVVAALLHDIGDMLAPYNHCELAAAILRPYVSEKTYWIVKHHGIFQAYYYAHLESGDRNARERYRDHPLLPGRSGFLPQVGHACLRSSVRKPAVRRSSSPWFGGSSLASLSCTTASKRRTREMERVVRVPVKRLTPEAAEGFGRGHPESR